MSNQGSSASLASGSRRFLEHLTAFIEASTRQVRATQINNHGMCDAISAMRTSIRVAADQAERQDGG